MAIKPSHILGMNSRYQYTKLNPSSAKQYGFSKLRTKQLMAENNISTATVYHVFESIEDLDEVEWGSIPTPFVIKPASGSAGKGVWVIKKKLPDKMVWIDSDGNQASEDDLNLHINNILDGEYSTWGSHHRAIVEEAISVHPALAKYAYKGTPDIRVIVFNSVPIMAEARIPTKESHGRANLDQGAIGLGIDMASGTTTYGIKGKKEAITHFPNSKKKVNGILIPYWTKVLETAVMAAQAAGYVYMGADLFIHPDKGPMIVELNGYPGLSIQLCNRAGLKRRIERVEGIDVRDPQHGVKIAQALFAESFADKVKVEEGLVLIDYDPTLTVLDDKRNHHQVEAIVNTGRHRSAISEALADELGLVDLDDLLWQQQELLEGKLPVVNVTFKLKQRTIKSAMVVTKRLNRTRYKIELGRNDLSGFVVGDNEQ